MRAPPHSFAVLETFSSEILEGRGMNNLDWYAEDEKINKIINHAVAHAHMAWDGGGDCRGQFALGK